ncbi:MAG: ammonia-forming cytochrome c nitrite reductase subunit c552 [Planctomycetes bacterium]|nr:ammonia-forming cytochrome c nitrite reductase subunit c552 [Planctomycetota bacterium]
MQPADESTVLGDFGNAAFEHFGVRSTFFRRDGKFFANTDGPDGVLADFEIEYTFGVFPLQQYLIELSGGRLQALSIAWDSRPVAEGGQRWFHLYPDEAVPAGDILHWTGPEQNWNYMCAECHSTNLRKHWRADEQRYDTQWSEIDVSCEACHGPGSAHVEWAKAAVGDPHSPEAEAEDSLARGLVIELRSEPIEWVSDPATGIAKPSRPPKARTEVEMCARCHARRTQLFDANVPGRPLLETHKPALLETQLYFADGQQLEEVYEYGSFLQSRMYAAGVSCGHCHDAHSSRIEGAADDVCKRCHTPDRFAQPEHHHHAAGSKGASCVECHMPARNYMVVDARRDHSIRVPRPDLTTAIGTPNACANCHADQSAAWARDAVATWYPNGRWTKPHSAEAIDAGRRGRPEAETALSALIDDKTQSGIVRATAIELLMSCMSPASLASLARAIEDPDALVRSAAVDALAVLPPPERVRIGFPLLSDTQRGVRIEAASALAGEARFLNSAQRAPFDAALSEYRAAQSMNADRPESYANLGSIAARMGDRAEARRAYETGLRRGPWFAGLWINLADLHRAEGDDAEGERVLRRGLAAAVDKAALHHALGLNLARQKRLEEALVELKHGVDLAPGDTTLAYVYGVALLSADRKSEARVVLAEALEQRPADRDLLYSLATLERDLGQLERARAYAHRLFEASHGDPGVRALLEELQAPAPSPPTRAQEPR